MDGRRRTTDAGVGGRAWLELVGDVVWMLLITITTTMQLMSRDHRTCSHATHNIYKLVEMKTIRQRQLDFFGHVMRKQGIEALVVTGKVEGRRARG